MNLNFYEGTSLEELFALVDMVKSKGDIVFIKFDGEREINPITIIISYPSTINKEQIRFEGDNLKELLFKTLQLYFA